jgi:hypothetical protein
MSNDWNTHRTEVTIFAVALTFALIAAFFTTLEHVDIRLANDVAQPGTIGLAKPHAPSIERPVSRFGVPQSPPVRLVRAQVDPHAAGYVPMHTREPDRFKGLCSDAAGLARYSVTSC